MNKDDIHAFSTTQKREITKLKTRHNENKLYNQIYWNNKTSINEHISVQRCV